jgi:hypothetical protein
MVVQWYGVFGVEGGDKVCGSSNDWIEAGRGRKVTPHEDITVGACQLCSGDGKHKNYI